MKKEIILGGPNLAGKTFNRGSRHKRSLWLTLKKQATMSFEAINKFFQKIQKAKAKEKNNT